MIPELNIWIEGAEETWLDALYDHARALYQNSSLPSHDHTHHVRVWNLCKLLLREIATFNSRLDYSLVEGVLIAALFHDLGMASSSREDHGLAGSQLCRSWFQESGKKTPERFVEIRKAIELHDRKDRQIYSTFVPEASPEILGILSVADDLEALGNIGIYRYSEIYLQRGIPLEDLGRRILENATARFENLSRGCQLCTRILDRYQPQYETLLHFFEQYNLQLQETSDPEKVQSGPLGVVNYIRTGGWSKFTPEHCPPELKDYFRKLEHELDQARI